MRGFALNSRRDCMRTILTRLELNRHITGAFRHANSWWSWYCRKDSVTAVPANLGTHVAFTGVPLHLTTRERLWTAIAGALDGLVEAVLLMTGDNLQCTRPITPFCSSWTVYFKGIDYLVECNYASDVRGLEGLPFDRAVSVSIHVDPLS